MSLTDASTRSFFEAEDNFQNNGSVVDILLDVSLPQCQRTQIFVQPKSVCYALLNSKATVDHLHVRITMKC